MIEEKIKYIFTSNSYVKNDEILEDIKKIKSKEITLGYLCNYPLVTLAAELCFVLGVKGIFTYASEEVEEIANLSNSLIVGPNNVSAEWFQGAYLAVKTLQKRKKPIILDLEKTNISQFRIEIAKQILEAGINIVKGSYSEIIKLEAFLNDSTNKNIIHESQNRLYSFNDAIIATQKLALKYNLTIVITGYTSFITDGKGIATILGNPTVLKFLPGIDNALTSMVAAFAVVDENYLRAGAKALSLIYSLIENLEQRNITGPASFHICLVDLLSILTLNELPNKLQCYYLDLNN